MVGIVQQRVQDDDDVGTGRRPTAAPGHDPETRTQADSRTGSVGRGRQTSLAAGPVRIDVGSAVPEPSGGDAAAVEQREPVERDDPQLVPARSHHPTGAEGHQSAGRRVLHVRVPVDAVLRAQPVAVRVPELRGRHQQGPHRPGHVAGLRQFHGQPGVLHHFQQGVPAGVQAGADVQVPRPQQATLVAAPGPRQKGLNTRRARPSVPQFPPGGSTALVRTVQVTVAGLG